MEAGYGITLALSGGGIRAMAFHMGVIRRLAELGRLEQVRFVSSVSGGSLITGLILEESGMRWPGSEAFLTAVYPALRKKLCENCIMKGMIRGLFSLKRIRFIFNRANLLAYTLHRNWGVKARLRDLPDSPAFAFEGTTAENGKRFFFSKSIMGDYDSGYTDCGKLPLATALAVSAAFPGGIGPLKIYTKNFIWDKPSFSSAGSGIVTPEFSSLNLYDGGVYDNLGLEPLFNIGSLSPKGKYKKAFLLVSDAGAPFKKGFSRFALNPLRLKRVMDVMQEQCRALRVRALYGYLKGNPYKGSYIRICDPTGKAEDEALRVFAANFPTTLRRLSESEFDRLARYGYLIAAKRLEDAAAPEPPEAVEEEETPQV